MDRNRVLQTELRNGYGLDRVEECFASLQELIGHMDSVLDALLVKERQETGHPAPAQDGPRQGMLRAPVTRAAETAVFDEDLYLELNPDVAAAVAKGACASAYTHWKEYGEAEGRGGGIPPRVRDRSRFAETCAARPYGVNLYGHLNAASGLGSVARGVRRALLSQATPLNVIDLPVWRSRTERHPPLPEPAPYRINLLQQNADLMPLFVRSYGEKRLWGYYNIGYWLWELPANRLDWQHLYNYVDEVWVASEFCRAAFAASTSLPVRRIPPVVDELEKQAGYGREHFGLPRDVFVFCYIFDVCSYMDRKNPLALVEAFCRAFGESTDVLLLLKYSNAGADPNSLRLLGEAVKGRANIRTWSAMLSEPEIVSLHQAIDCFVSPHRSEGFGLNLVECMYFGKPVIATRYSSNLDYMHDGNSYLIDCTLRPVDRTVGPYLKNSVWAEPSVDHLSDLLRMVYADRQGREERGRQAAREVRETFSAQAVGTRMRDRFRELGLDAPGVAATLFSRPRYAPPPPLFAAGVPEAIRGEIRSWRYKPVISVLTPVFNARPEHLLACIESVRSQYYPFWELCLTDDGSSLPETLEELKRYQGLDGRIRIVYSPQNQGISLASNRCAEMSGGEFLAMLDNDDELTPDALYEFARALNEDPEADLLYCDEDKIEPDGTCSEPYFKPDFSPEHLRSVMYVLHMLMVRKTAFYEVGGFRPGYEGSQDYDLALRLSEITSRVRHVTKVLYHWRKTPGSAAAVVDAKPQALAAARRALEDHVRRGGLGRVEDGRLPGTYRVRYAVGNPRVSLLILTGDPVAEIERRGPIRLLENLVKSIEAKTEYRNYEIVVVDDGNLSKQTRQALSDCRYRVASYRRRQPGFNFAEKANFAVSQAGCEHMVLLNDDMEVIAPGWLEALLEPLRVKEVGITGGRLLFANGRIQHVGVVLGVNSGAAHVYHNAPGDRVGYNGFTDIIRNYSAVTAACLATRADVIEATGGFDPAFAIDYNDIDFCLSAIQHGYRVVYTPYAELYHFEGKSCQRRAQDPAEVERFFQKWGGQIERDPYYNPNLARNAVDYSVDAARADWPRMFA